MMKIENLDEELAKLQVGSYDYLGTIKELYENIQNEQDQVTQALRDIDSIRNDLLHILELESLNAPKRSQVTTALHKTLVKRRIIKDRSDYLYKIYNSVKPLEPKLSGSIETLQKITERFEKGGEERAYKLRKLIVSDIKNPSIVNNEELKIPSKVESFYDRYKGRHRMDNPDALKEVVSK